MKISAQGRKEAARMVKKWKDRLFLQEWNIDIQFPDQSSQNHDTPGNGDILADCHPDPIYKNVLIRIYPEWADRNKEIREESLLHELCHCLVEPAARKMFDLRNGRLIQHSDIVECVEEITQKITRVVYYL